MQLISLTLYNEDGRSRSVDFETGALNIVTGASKSGKSALLTIIEYCLGRDTLLVPVGPISNTVAWYGALWELEGGARVFVGRPRPASGKQSTSQAMLEFGGADLAPPAYPDLVVNIDTTTLREQLGRRIGIEENAKDRPQGSLQAPLQANIGHAALLCLQSQSEVANQNVLFHRQAEDFMDQTLRDTLPYFLGAVPSDQAQRRVQLREARRVLQRAEAALRSAAQYAGTIEVQLRAVWGEARAAGLVDTDPAEDRATLVRELADARGRVDDGPADSAAEDLAAQTRRTALGAEREEARQELQRVLADRQLLLEQGQSLGPYESAVDQQAGRLTSLNLLGVGDATADESHCPACGHELDSDDTPAAAMYAHLARLTSELAGLSSARPAQTRALTVLDSLAAEARARLSAADSSLAALGAADAAVGGEARRARDFTRGRIDAILGAVPAVDEVELARLTNERDSASRVVEELAVQLAESYDADLLTSRLLAVGAAMTTFANALELEHSDGNVRLSIDRLSVVTDTDAGPVTLMRIGSAENWMGYHVATHLALHRLFTLQNRPVPRLLVLDQPTQAYFPSEVAVENGEMNSDADLMAVRRLFELLRDAVADLAPRFQVIVCDHVEMTDDWFQESIRYNWRQGAKLIPLDWIE